MNSTKILNMKLVFQIVLVGALGASLPLFSNAQLNTSQGSAHAHRSRGEKASEVLRKDKINSRDIADFKQDLLDAGFDESVVKEFLIWRQTGGNWPPNLRQRFPGPEMQIVIHNLEMVKTEKAARRATSAPLPTSAP
jgi:hypothetical protein